MNETERSETIEAFNNAVLLKMQCGMSREQAVNATKREQPALSRQFILASNPSMAATRQLMERFDVLPLN